MPRFTRNKRKCTASDHESHANNSSATDGNTASNDGRSNNVPRYGEASDGLGSSTEARNNQDGNRAASNSVGGTSISACSSGSTRLSSVGDNRLGEDSNNRRQPPAPLTRDDIPALVREITRQLRLDNTEVHPPLVPGTLVFFSVSRPGFPLISPRGSNNI